MSRKRHAANPNPHGTHTAPLLTFKLHVFIMFRRIAGFLLVAFFIKAIKNSNVAYTDAYLLLKSSEEHAGSYDLVA